MRRSERLDALQATHDMPKTLAFAECGETFYIFEDKNLRLLGRNVFEYMLKQMASTLIVIKALLLACRAKGLAREA